MPSSNRFVGFKCDPVIYAALAALVTDPAEAARAKLSEETRSVAEAALFADAGKRRRGGSRKKTPDAAAVPVPDAA